MKTRDRVHRALLKYPDKTLREIAKKVRIRRRTFAVYAHTLYKSHPELRRVNKENLKRLEAALCANPHAKIADLQKEFGVSLNAIYRRKRKLGQTTNRLSHQEKELLIRLRHLPSRKIARILKRGATTVTRARKKLGLENPFKHYHRRRQRVYELTQEGFSTGEISHLLDSPTRNIRRDIRILEERGFCVRKTAAKTQILQIYQKNPQRTPAQIARIVGCSAQHVGKTLHKEAGLQPKPRPTTTTEAEKQAIKELLNQGGLSLKEISRTTGRSLSTVNKISKTFQDSHKTQTTREEQIQKLTRLALMGKSDEEIAQEIERPLLATVKRLNRILPFRHRREAVCQGAARKEL